MEVSTKAKITVGLLACFAMVWGLFQQAITAPELLPAVAIALAQIVAIIIIAFVIMTLLEWINIFDLKTNAILTLIVLITIRVSYIIVL